jgi:hypothetical protein
VILPYARGAKGGTSFADFTSRSPHGAGNQKIRIVHSPNVSANEKSPNWLYQDVLVSLRPSNEMINPANKCAFPGAGFA